MSMHSNQKGELKIKIKIILTLMMVMMMSMCSAYSIEITGEKATADYWLLKNPMGNNILMNPAQIASFNEQIRMKDKFATDLKNYPSTLSATKVNELIKLGEYKLYKGNHNVQSDVKVRYAVTIARGNIRLQPTEWNGDNYDNAQGTAIDPAEAVAVISELGNYVFVQSRNYVGWLNKKSIAFTDRNSWLQYVQPEKFLVVTANKTRMTVIDRSIMFQMGAIIPLIEKDSTFFHVLIPDVENGKLINRRIKIDKYSLDFNEGFLPCTENNFINQGFSFLGDEYGWGGLNDSVDCSSFVQNVYRTMGLEIPRDADRQEACMAIWAVFNNVTTAERFDIVSRAPIGSLLFKPGHVMMKIGNDVEPIVIHSASSYFNNGQKIYIRKVLVSDLHYKNYSGVETINGLTGIAHYK